MELYRKNRPDSLAGIVGNENAVKTLQSIVDNTERRPHTFFVCWACWMWQDNPSVHHGKCGRLQVCREQNSADYRGIDSVRELIEELVIRPVARYAGPYSFWKRHRLRRTQEALLKPVENCP